MKRIYYIIILILIIIIIIPGIIVSYFPIKPIHDDRTPKITKDAQDEQISLYNSTTQKVQKIPIEEYVIGVVAAEMPGSFHTEALKAQTVAARTYVYRRWRKIGGSGCNLHPEADVCDNPSHCQAWIDKKQMLKKWGIFSYYHFYSKLQQAAHDTYHKVIFYQGKPIDPLFFSTSNGKTENSEDVWESQIAYLRSVVSPGEETAPRFFAEKQIPVKTFISKLKANWPDIVIDTKNPEKEIKVLSHSTGGRVKEILIGNKRAKGTEIRKIFELNSTDFKIKRSKDNIIFTTTGYGHGVGMSQYGAEYMAKQGENYIKILKHYYTGVEIVGMSSDE